MPVRSDLDRSPKHLAADFQAYESLKLDVQSQRRLGCIVNEDVFLECPYAFVPHRVLLELAQESDSPFQAISGKVVSCSLEDVLVGYAEDKLFSDDPVEFVICLTEEATSLFVTRNRQITRTILDMVHQEINKRHSKPWQERGDRVDDGRLLASRDSLELNVALPLSQLCRPRLLGDRRPDDVRDGCVELVELYQRYECVAFTTIAKPSQTTLPYDEQWVQTYPGNPKNQWTQYEFVVPDEFLEIWKDDDKDEANSDEQGGEAQIENEDNDQEVSEEQLQLEKKRRSAREKLQQFLRNRSKDLLAEVSFNASTNLYKNDVANLSKRETIIETREEHRDYYEEKVSLIDLNATKGKYLYAAAWHCKVEHIIVAAYADRMAKDYSLVAVWSLLSPLRPKIILDCLERISMLSFCPIEDYTNIMIGGRIDGKIVVWEINESLLVENEEETDSLNESTSNEPEHKEARIAISAEKSQRKCITGIQWLPTWCRIESDGNFQRNASCAPKDRKVCFATSSAEGTIYFWPLPRALSRPATARSPLHLTIAPIYQLVIDDQDDKTAGPMALTCFSLPLAKSEESSNLSIRDDADLERLRKVFVGTSGGEVMTCTWESMTFSLDISDREVCKITHRCCLHDGPVRSMIKSPHLDDIFLTVGGRVFAVWKEDYDEGPIFKKRSPGCLYGEACWTGRAGIFALSRLDGSFEIWDLKKKSHAPVLWQVISSKVTPFLYPSPPRSSHKFLALLDGISSLRVFCEPHEKSNNKELERLEWFEEFAWRETRRKRDFLRWQADYLSKNPVALQRKIDREQAEIHRKHEEARKKFLEEQAELLRREAEEKLAQRRVSKTIIWRQNELKRAEKIIFSKKRLVPQEFEEKCRPLVELEQERNKIKQKTKKYAQQADRIFHNFLAKEMSYSTFDLMNNVGKNISKGADDIFVTKSDDHKQVSKLNSHEREDEFQKLKIDLLKQLKNEPYKPRFDWHEAMKVLGIICMACGSGGGGGGSWFLFVAITAFILTVLWSLFYLFSLRDVIKLPINWLATELLNTGIYAILYFTAFITELTIAYWTTHIVAGVFGIFNTLAYAAGAYFLYLEYKGQ
ncbi:hypothetical protein TKK_0016788 [Trichogramma kaykai]